VDRSRHVRHFVTRFPAVGLDSGYHRPRVSRPAAMKAKRRSRTHKKTPTHGKKRHKARRTTRVGHAAPTAPIPSPPPAPISSVKTCQEVEVGDIGGFGSPEKLEAHEKRCGQEAAEFCNTCARNLCRNHYELLHRDHDTIDGHTTGQSLTSQ